jgi:hypothetical protein
VGKEYLRYLASIERILLKGLLKIYEILTLICLGPETNESIYERTGLVSARCF